MSATWAFHQAIPDYLTHDGDRLVVKLAVGGEQPDVVRLRTEPDNEERLIDMVRVEERDGWIWYQAEIDVPEPGTQVRYLFKLVWSHRLLWYGALGLDEGVPTLNQMFRYVPDHQVPDWVSRQVFYQIFPDRFAEGDPNTTPETDAYDYLHGLTAQRRRWGDAPLAHQGPVEFFGGDLPGIEQRLDYLADELGVTALYLNPVFTSRSNHKYDTVDYYTVDPHLGGNDALVSLSDRLHEKGMKLMLDAVINHTSVYHPWFQRALEGDTECRARYVFRDDDSEPPVYASWKGHDSLPVLDFANPANVETFITGEDSVIKHWLRPPYSIDGWRMDVIHMLGEGAGARNNHHHVRRLRQAIKTENPNAYLLGEHFFEATPWLQGDQEDGAMNYYGFGHPVRAFLAGLDIAYDPIRLDAAGLARWLAKARAAIPFAQQQAQLNQLDSHDTRRLITMLNDDRVLFQAAIGLLMTYIGAPCLYYGDEIAMPGGDDPDCRRSFPWDRDDWPSAAFSATQRWIRHRRASEALQTGALIDLYAEGDVYVFARVLAGEQCLVAVNRGDACDVTFADGLTPMVAEWRCVEGGGELNRLGSNLSLRLPARSTVLWRRLAG